MLLPYTIGTVAGGGAATTAGTACVTGSPYVATDAYGDGCPALQAVFSSDIRGGVAVDPLGNVYVADTSNSQVRKVDARSGLITTFAGGNKVCSAAVDKNGDGCLSATATLLNSPRGVGSDPYGNILIAGYSDNLVHLVCNVVSPLCSQAQIGTMRIAAGCSTTATAYGSSGNTGDGLTGAGVCGATVATVNQPRGVVADRFGNIYVGDTGNSRLRVVVGPVVAGVTNPLIAILQLNPANSGLTAANAAGKIFAIVGGAQFTVPAAGATCASGVALDGYGDGCPFYNTNISTVGGFVQGVAVDSFGNFIFADSQSVGRVRVIYAGGTGNPMAHVITVNNPTVLTPVAGYAYSIAGGGSTATPVTPILANTASLDGNLFRVTTDSFGNIFVGDNTTILFLDVNTGYLRKVAGNNTVCTGANAAGDGCPALQASFGGSTGVLGLALDNLGNLFFADGTNHTIRKVSATSFTPSPLNAGVSRAISVHAPPGVLSVTSALAANTDFALGTNSCTLNAPPGDGSYDCVIPVTFTPTQLGLRDAPITLTPSTGTAIHTSLTATATGTGLAFDPAAPAVPATQTIGSGIPTGVALDGHGNLYTVDSTSLRVVRITGGTSTPISTALQAAPNQIAVDPAGNVYATTGSATLTKLTLNAPSTYTQGSLTNSAFTSSAAVAVDANGNVYVADSSTGAVLKFSQTTGLATTLTATALNTPVALALDNLGNLLVADKGAGKVYRLSTAGIMTGLPAVVPVAGTVVPVGVAADAAGNVYIADASHGSVYLVPLTGPQTVVATGFSSINGIAVDGAGNLLVASLANNGLTKVLRSQFSFDFGSDVSLNLSGTLTNTGNMNAQGIAQTDTIDFQLNGAGSTCNPASTSIASGAACTAVASFTPAAAGGGAVSDAVSFLPAATTLGALNLTATKAGSLTTTMTTISGQTPSAPVYVAGGASVTFTVAVVASTGTAGGNLNVTVDGGAPVTYALGPNGSVAVPITGLSAGNHTIGASYPSQAGISGSTAVPVTFSVAQATTTVTWTPASLTRQYSQAIGTSVFNASSGGVAGAFVYTATPAGGAALAVDSSSYLPVGTYGLSVTFTPTDAIDYKSSTATLSGFTVAKASTTAAVGASQNVVAADGSGNFSSITAAVAALPPTGGSIYIRPGTYNEQFTISYPNVSLRGLGGVAQNVILTAEHGAFSAPFPAGVPAGNNGAQGDQGSATVVVDKSTINGTSYTPNFFYAENLSIFNTYNTDATNQNTLAVVNGTCTPGQPAQSNAALYNAGTLCASQALALWTRSDKSVLNNVRLNSLQDTLYAGSQGCGSTCVPARQYYFNGYIAGDVDYIFGDAAVVFDHTTFYTAWHGNTATGTETIEAQNKMQRTGSSTDYLSGYILNSANLTSQSSGMTNLYYGRPYGPYSTFVLLNTTVDQVNPTGWIEFSGDSNLPTSTYAEYNTLGAGGTQASISGRETTSLRPEQLTAAQAAQYAPLTFLGTAAPDVWNAADALTANVNAFVPSGSTLATLFGKSVTILARPQTPGGGANPTGAYTLMDGSTVLSSGTLDASGSVYYTSSSFAAGQHNITFSYSGDNNFSASSTTTPLVITVGGTSTSLTVTTSNPVYGAPVAASVVVQQNATTNALTGTVSLSVDNGTPVVMPVGSGTVSFSLNGVSAGSHTLTATYSGDTYNGSSTASANIVVAKANLTVTGPTISVVFGGTVPAYTPTYSGFVNTDTAATALTGAPALATTPAVPSAVGSYPIVVSAGTLASSNYTFTFVNGLLTIGRATTATVLTSPSTAPGLNATTTFTATVTSSAKGTLTGSVSFYSGTTLLNSITLTPAGTATLSTSFSAAASATVTAVYSGDQSYATSTSNAIVVSPVSAGFTITSNPTSLSIARGTVGVVTLTLTPLGNYQGTATFACTNLPANVTCSFGTPYAVFSGGSSAVTTPLTITTGGNSVAALHLSGDQRVFAGFLFLPALVLAGFAARRKAVIPAIRGVCLLLMLASGLAALSGCGTSSQSPLASVGTQSFTVTATGVNGSGSGTVTQQVAINLTITQ